MLTYVCLYIISMIWTHVIAQKYYENDFYISIMLIYCVPFKTEIFALLLSSFVIFWVIFYTSTISTLCELQA